MFSILLVSFCLEFSFCLTFEWAVFCIILFSGIDGLTHIGCNRLTILGGKKLGLIAIRYIKSLACLSVCPAAPLKLLDRLKRARA
jgi:hypothetical protein